MKCVAPSKKAIAEAAAYGDGNIITDEKAHSIMIDAKAVHVKCFWANWEGASATFYVDLEEGTVLKESAGVQWLLAVVPRSLCAW